MDVCVLNQAGEGLRQRDMTAAPAPCLQALASSREVLGAAHAASPGTWRAARCAPEGRPWVLGPARSLTAIHGGKAPNARRDALPARPRLPRGQACVASVRLGTCAQASAGHPLGPLARRAARPPSPGPSPQPRGWAGGLLPQANRPARAGPAPPDEGRTGWTGRPRPHPWPSRATAHHRSATSWTRTGRGPLDGSRPQGRAPGSRCQRRSAGDSAAIRVWCRPASSAPARGHAVRSRVGMPASPAETRGAYAASRRRVPRDNRGPPKGEALRLFGYGLPWS